MSGVGLQVLVGEASWPIKPPFSLLVQQILHQQPNFTDSEINTEDEKIAMLCATKCAGDHVHAQYRVTQKHS